MLSIYKIFRSGPSVLIAVIMVTGVWNVPRRKFIDLQIKKSSILNRK